MIHLTSLQKFANLYQTTIENVIREYLQHLFLSFLYQEKGSGKLFFKGGTALRLIWQSPRFSEDMDFTGIQTSISQIEFLAEAALSKIESQGIQTNIDESKETSGGYFSIFQFQVGDHACSIQVQVSLRNKANEDLGISALIHSDLLPPYTLMHLDEKTLVREKIQACLTRSKARDFYDLYFILRSRLAFKATFMENKALKTKLITIIEKQKLDLKSELKIFLPVNQHMLLKNFKSVLLREIERNLPS
jgi:predicted nucleotidyltransferase component of viral defense system